MDNLKARKRSFWGGGIVAALFVAFAIIEFANGSTSSGSGFLVFAVLGFTFVSCLVLGNNFIGDAVETVFSWGFVTMPGLIFTLDLDGIIWLLTMKLLFWVLGILLAIFFGLLAVFIGAVLSVFVYPFAIAKNIKSTKQNNPGEN